LPIERSFKPQHLRRYNATRDPADTLDSAVSICKMHIEMEESVMNDEERKREAETRKSEFRGVGWYR
jgi:hypothetical protein